MIHIPCDTLIEVPICLRFQRITYMNKALLCTTVTKIQRAFQIMQFTIIRDEKKRELD